MTIGIIISIICTFLFQFSKASAASSNTVKITPRAAIEPCAQVNQAIDQWMLDHGKGGLAEIDPAIAYACLNSVPIYTEPALALIQSFSGWIELQSHLDVLKTVPQGYLYDSVDLRKCLESIHNRVKNGQYYGEYDFQVDIQSLFIRARDYHFNFVGELKSVFSFERPFGIVNISPDGKIVPQIYIRDYIYQISERSILLKHDSGASPIRKINGVEVKVFLSAESYAIPYQDPDACWNGLFDNLYGMSLRQSGRFRSPTFYPGVATTIEFFNGSTVSHLTKAKVVGNWQNLTTGDEVYQNFCTHLEQSTDTVDSDGSELSEGSGELEQATSTTFMASESTTAAQATPLLELTLYPTPEIVDASGILSGYFLDHPYDDTAVLAVTSFQPSSPNTTPSGNWAASFQDAIEEFLAAANKQSRRNLILDLQHNPGGNVYSSIDIYAQLFPNDPPNAKHNMRASLGMEVLMKSAAAFVTEKSNLDPSRLDTAEIEADIIAAPFAWQNMMTPDVINFKNFQDYYGPNKIANAEFTAFFQDNYTNAEAFGPDFAQEIVITGTNDRTGYPQYFDSKNIIMLHDGTCGSACTMFSEYMKNHARVQSIAIGGRPQTGPMQGVGNTKGSQVFEGETIVRMITLFQNATNYLGTAEYEHIVKGTTFESWDPDLAITRSSGSFQINGRNHYRIGDGTQTPLQFVYEASDCRIWNTAKTIANITLLWERVADITFYSGTYGVFNSDYCVKDSTGHPTSLSGGLKKGEIGDQKPPANAKPSVKGWLINGTTISEQGPARYASPGSGQNVIAGAPLDKAALGNFVELCDVLEADAWDAFEGDAWLFRLMCDTVKNAE